MSKAEKILAFNENGHRCAVPDKITDFDPSPDLQPQVGPGPEIRVKPCSIEWALILVPTIVAVAEFIYIIKN